ncbi:cystathionine gamma-synthase family protein [Putridiphycobacter roseus]|uniref:Cystathionine gamma-synthase family protein n=1 Tax=Putridiphycobacter roseus TaxID=2219161 RepID=A0A2W1MYL8_9FLAO|nr:cystathionine gamma-synthase family protein [Putridiphycobacter roseus]PZE16310.1 cystathionine gamma-synthase family protein [Putridiphycobacter roseus]
MRKPESQMMSYGYKPSLSEGAIKCPIFQTSTFVFKSAEEGKAFFELAYGLREQDENEEMGLIYSRLNNPDLEILENRLSLWDEAEDCAVFESGMAAISTVLMEFLAPGDLLLYSNPIYGGSDHFIKHVLTKYGIHILPFDAKDNEEAIIEKLNASGLANKLALVYIETPANPTNALIDIAICHKIANQFSTEEKEVILAVDNTYMGPVWQHPIKHGADLVMYSATKYIGGHSDVIAGAVLGNKANMGRIKGMRTFLGNQTSPNTGWLLMRSLETLKLRMDKQEENAAAVAEYLAGHELVEKIYYLGMLEGEQQAIFNRQCEGTGAMVSFDIKGGEKAAFKFLNNLKLIKLAVSLGGTESLAEHPASMTHAGVDKIEREHHDVTDNLVRLSIGVEHYTDIIEDVAQALKSV